MSSVDRSVDGEEEIGRHEDGRGLRGVVRSECKVPDLQLKRAQH